MSLWGADICNQILELYERERTLFSIIQSSSSSSSVDEKTKNLPDCPSIAAMGIQDTPQGHPIHSNFPNNSSFPKSNKHKSSSLAIRPPSASLPTTKPKLGLKDFPDSASKESALTSNDDTEIPSKRKRAENNEIGDSKHGSKHKLTAVPRKGIKGLPTRSK